MLAHQETDIRRDMLDDSLALGKHRKDTLRKLADAIEESQTAQDGYGQIMIDVISYYRAIRFLELLPSDSPVPDVYIDTEGEVRYEWFKGPRQVFSVAVRGNGQLAYAGLFGAGEAHGIEYLDNDLPDAISMNIDRVFAGGFPVAVRASRRK
ncbi:MAG: hypothetical protein HY670_10830 [Chloroflexi bacterium]|nr:hypothetical protein [Chloroflexota bacterium]